jgi:hypothetical protein
MMHQVFKGTFSIHDLVPGPEPLAELGIDARNYTMAVDGRDDYLDVASTGDICKPRHRDWGKD